MGYVLGQVWILYVCLLMGWVCVCYYGRELCCEVLVFGLEFDGAWYEVGFVTSFVGIWVCR